MNYKTGKREKILSYLSQNKARSFTLEEICEGVLGEDGGKSTVYRLVSELVGEGKLLRLSDGRTRHCSYQYIGTEVCRSHLHFKCTRCGRVIHLDERTTEEISDRINSAGGFKIDIGEMIFGTCGSCVAGEVSV